MILLLIICIDALLFFSLSDRKWSKRVTEEPLESPSFRHGSCRTQLKNWTDVVNPDDQTDQLNHADV